MILGIDTATSAIAVAVGVLGAGGAVEVLQRGSRSDPRAHTERLAPLVAEVLESAGTTPEGLERIVVGTGPGPFTGLRVGIVTAVTMGYALGIPVHGTCSLDALASATTDLGDARPAEVLVATDARRAEVYWARYAFVPREGDLAGWSWVRTQGPAVDRPADLPAAVRALPVVGRGPRLYPEFFPNPLDVPPDVDAGQLLAVAGPRIAAGEPMPPAPRYLRRPDALTSAERAAR